MAAKREKIELEKNEEKKAKPFQKFFFIVVIPLLFALMVVLIVAAVAGVNVFGEVHSAIQKLPFVSAQKTADSFHNYQKKLKELQAEVKDRDNQISQLQTKIANKTNDLQQSQLQNTQLQQEIDDLNTAQKQSKRALKDVVTTYETMSPKKAAPIISKMSDTQALQILTAVKTDTLASIMENMDATQAARFTELMTKQQDTTQQSSQ